VLCLKMLPINVSYYLCVNYEASKRVQRRWDVGAGVSPVSA
jgi:hypothetical protein